MLVFLPLFVIIPLVGKQLSMKQQTLEASRYAIWERTVWGGGGARSAGGASKSNAVIALEASDRITGDPDAAIKSPQASAASGGASANPLWVDRRGRALLADAAGRSGAQTAQTAAVPALARVGLTGLAQSTAQRRFGLQASGFVRGGYAQTQRPAASDWGRLRLAGRQGGTNDGIPGGRNDLIVQSADGVILTNAWAAPNEQVYRDRVDAGVFDEALANAEIGLASSGPVPLTWCSIPLAGCSGNPPIGEIGYGRDTIDNGNVDTLVPESGTLPSRYVAP